MIQAPHSPDDGARSRTEVALYIAELAAELTKMARSHRLDALGFILDMARLEAENAAKPLQGRVSATRSASRPSGRADPGSDDRQ